MRLLFPSIAPRLLPRMVGIALAGALLAGLYGIIHDQITYSISPEYFTRFKFDQFESADFGFSDRFFVAEIGFLATWWIGLIAGWFFARIALPAWPAPLAVRRILLAFTIMITFATLAGIAGMITGSRPAAAAGWESFCLNLGIDDIRSFTQVGHIHIGSYLGGMAGLVAALLFLRHLKLHGS